MYPFRSIRQAGLAIWPLLFFLASPMLAQEDLIEITGLTMGPIPYKVLIAGQPKSLEPEDLQESVVKTLERINQRMSTYIPESEVSQFNVSTSTDFQDVSEETAIVIKRSLEISKQTNGAFDITVGPAVNLWKFGPDKDDFRIPTVEETDQLKSTIGYLNLDVRLDPPAIKKSIPELKIDLSAIAKGYAVDAVAKALSDLGCTRYMVEVGGEVVARGKKTADLKWRIGVERPHPDERQRVIGEIAEIENVALATSGDYRNYKEVEGQRFSHTIDPKTCRPVTHFLATSCIVAPDCMTADALATAVMVMGTSQGEAKCDELGLEYIFIERDSAFGEELTETISDGFPLAPPAPPAQNEEAQSAIQSILPTFIGAAVVFGLVILGMALGSIFGNKPVQGSCGGLANMTNEDGEEVCGVCSKPTTDCVEKTEKEPAV